MTVKRIRKSFIRISLLIVLLATVGLVATGCVQNLTPVGWSGGNVSDGTLYVGSKEGKLVAVNLSDESRLWSEALKASSRGAGFGCAGLIPGGGCQSGSAGVAIYGTPVVSGDLAYIGGYNGKIYAFATETLSTRWIYPREGNLEPVVGGLVAAGGRIFFGDSGGNVYALDAATGDKLWEYTTDDKIWTTPAVDGDILYVGSFDGTLYALNTADGSVKWRFTRESAMASVPMLHDGTIYAGSFDRNLYAIDAATGSLRWEFMGRNWFWATPLYYDNNIYAGCMDGKVYVIEADSGRLVTEYELDSPAASSPVVVNNSVIFASKKGVIYAIDTVSQNMTRLADIGKEVYGPLAAAEGIIYIHTADLALHRINAQTGTILTTISLEQ